MELTCTAINQFKQQNSLVGIGAHQTRSSSFAAGDQLWGLEPRPERMGGQEEQGRVPLPRSGRRF